MSLADGLGGEEESRVLLHLGRRVPVRVSVHVVRRLRHFRSVRMFGFRLVKSLSRRAKLGAVSDDCLGIVRRSINPDQKRQATSIDAAECAYAGATQPRHSTERSYQRNSECTVENARDVKETPR